MQSRNGGSDVFVTAIGLFLEFKYLPLNEKLVENKLLKIVFNNSKLNHNNKSDLGLHPRGSRAKRMSTYLSGSL